MNITILLVLYKTELDKSVTYISLKKNMVYCKFGYNFLVYNNSSEITVPYSDSYDIVNSSYNELLFGAYNYGLNYSKEKNNDWILLLDQDTELTKEYILTLNNILNAPIQPNIMSIVPRLISENKKLSPRKISSFGWWDLEVKSNGIVNGAYAYNSLSLLKVEFILSLGGFSKDFKLDMLDHWYYNKINEAKLSIYVMNVFIQHKLSLLDYEKEVSLERHEKFLNAEYNFVKNELSIMHFFSYKIRLTLRISKQFLFFKDRRYYLVTLKTLLNRK